MEEAILFSDPVSLRYVHVFSPIIVTTRTANFARGTPGRLLARRTHYTPPPGKRIPHHFRVGKVRFGCVLLHRLVEVIENMRDEEEAS